ncbi:MAG: biotin transporter BioY [Firmicutes bacterium]|nr:biotin transporter BioY [Bacillota bacterium]
MKTKSMTLCAVFAAVMCVFCVITIPIGPVPVTLGVFAVLLTAVILGPKLGAISVLVYILLGAVGLPVFSGFKGGFQILLGPTGGYIWSYILMALLIGFLTITLPDNKWLAMLKIFTACLAGIIVCYALGTVQFMLVQKTGLTESLGLCVIPFIPFDIGKAAAASYLGFTVKNALVKSNFID